MYTALSAYQVSTGNTYSFYFITDSNNVIYDYGTRTNGKSSYYEAQLLPYGGSKAYNVYGYDENGYDNKGYKTDGYNDAGYDRDGYDRKGFNSDGYDRDGYDKSGYNANGYDRGGYKKDGYNDAGYDKDGYDRDGYNKNGYDRDGYGRDGYNKKGYDEYGYDRNGYDKEGYDRDGYDKDGYDIHGDDKDGYDNTNYNRYTNAYRNDVDGEDAIYTENYSYGSYIKDSWCEIFGIPNEIFDEKEDYAITDAKYRANALKKHECVRWYIDGCMVNDDNPCAAWTNSGYYNFEIAYQPAIRSYYVNNSTQVMHIAPSKKKESKTKYQCSVVYMTFPKAYVNNYYINIMTNKGSSKQYKIKSRYMKVNLHFGDEITVCNFRKDHKVCQHPFSYKLVPSKTWFSKSSVSKYKGKLLNIADTKVNIKKNKVKHDMLYLANIDASKITVSSSDNEIVKATKETYGYSTKGLKKYIKAGYYKFDKGATKTTSVKLTGGSNKGTATVTIKDKVTGKTEKITVTNK